MTLDDLTILFRKARNDYSPYIDSGHEGDRAGIIAVVTALRGELSNNWIDCSHCDTNMRVFSETLAPREGGNGAAGGPTSNDGRTSEAAVSLYAATDRPPAPAAPLTKCVWTKLPTFGFTISCTDKWLINSNYGGDTCPECGGLIEYKRTEAQR